MTRFKDFGTGADGDQKEPLTFKLHGEEFRCLPQVQGKLMLDLANNGDDNSPGQTAKFIGKFFVSVLEDESYKRFDDLLTSKDRIVSVETLSEIIGWLVEEYTTRPEEQPELSSAGQ